MIYNMRRRKKKVSLKWYFSKNVIPITTSKISFTAAFKSADLTFTGMQYNTTKIINEYVISTLEYIRRPFNTTVLDRNRGWSTEKYRTVEFEKEPTGELLRFLQLNATPL